MVKEFNERPEDFHRYFNHLGKRVTIPIKKAHNLLCLVEAAQETGGDVVIVYDGEEGSTKSTQAQQDGRFLDQTLNENRICFNPADAVALHFKGLPEDFDDRIDEYNEGKFPNKPWEVIILDESAGLDRKKTMSVGSKDFVDFMTQSRQLHKIFLIVLPNIHMLDSYVAEHRAVALIHCFKRKRTDLGWFKWFTREDIQDMFTGDKAKRKFYYPPKPAFMERANATKPFDLTEYNKKKAQALKKYRKVENPSEEVEISNEDAIDNYINEQVRQYPILKDKCKGLTIKAFCVALNIHRHSFYERADKMGVVVRTKETAPEIDDDI